MGVFYISAFTVDFRDYDSLENWARRNPDRTVGVELAADWAAPGFYDALEKNMDRFRDLPVTLHGPFIEMCTKPGSDEERLVTAQLERSCRLYHRMNANSIVLHTHLAAVPTEHRQWARERAAQVLGQWIRVMVGQGMCVTVENVGYPQRGNALFGQEQFLELFETLPAEAGCLIDIGHAILNGWDIPQLIRRMGSKIRGYHLHSNDGYHDSHLPLFDAASVYRREKMEMLLRTIAEVTPEAHLIFEYSPKVNVTGSRIHADMEVVERIFGES